MKILFVYGNTNTLLLPPPVGLMLVAENARAAGHTIQIVDFMKEKDPEKLLIEALINFSPNLTAFSLRNLDNQNMLHPQSYIPLYQKWVETANQYSKTIIGGSAFSTYPIEMMKEINAHYGFEGQGDQNFSIFLNELEEQKENFTTPGVLWRKGDEICRNKGIVKGYPMGGMLNWDLIDRKKYKSSYQSWAVITKTGCPHSCIICDTQVTFGNAFVPRDPDLIIEEISRNQKNWRLNQGIYMFIDDIFNEPIEWSKELCEKIIKSNLKIGFGVIVEPTIFDRELIGLMKQAGCIWATGLILSASDHVLELNKKSFTQAKIKEFIDLCEEEKLFFMPQFMLGIPGDSQEHIDESLKFINQYKLIWSDADIGARIQKQTELYEISIEKGIISKDDNLAYPKFYWEPGLSLEWAQKRLMQYKRERNISYKKWLYSLFDFTKIFLANIKA